MPTDKQTYKRILLIGNFFNESYSMNIYAEELFLNAVKLTDSVSLFKPSYIIKGKFKLFYKYIYFPFVILLKRNISIYHILDHSYGFLVYFLRIFKPGKIIIISCHDLAPLYDPGNILNRANFPSISFFLWKFSIRAMSKANMIIANSNYLKNLIIKYLPVNEKKIKVLYLGVKPCIENGDLDSYTKIPQNGFIILSVGTNEKRKNINTMIKVFIAISKEAQNKKIFFLRVGEYLNEEQKKIISEAGLSDKFVELGGMSYNALSLLYRKCGCLLFISTDEGFSLTCTEAMNNNLPVIASNVSSLPEIIGDEGLLVDPFNVDEIKESIVKVMKMDKSIIELINKAKNKAALFSWNKAAKNLLEIYASIEK